MKRFASSPQNWILLTAYCLLITVLSACQTVETFLPTPTPTATATPTLTPTPTIVWFPPTNTPTPPPTVEIPPTPDQLAGLGDLLYADDFSTGDGWPLLNSARGNVALSKNSLTLAVFDARASVSSVMQGGVFSNFYMEITAKTSLCSGEDQYGVLFRAASNADFYRFALTCDGQTRLDRVVGGTASSPQDWMFSSVIPVGPSGTVRLGVWAVGREMRFFINDEFHFTVSDPMIPSGGIGVYARAAGDTALTVNFSDLEVYAVSP